MIRRVLEAIAFSVAAVMVFFVTCDLVRALMEREEGFLVTWARIAALAVVFLFAIWVSQSLRQATKKGEDP